MMYSVCSAVGWRSFWAPACASYSSAARKSSPRKTKLLFLPFASHSIARVSRRVCARTHLRSVSSARIRVSVASSKSSLSRQKIQFSSPSDFGTPVGRYIAMDDRHEAFIVGRCVRDFLAAHLRSDRIRCEHEDERMGSFDCPVDRFLPCVSGRNPFPIYPCFPITTLHFLV